MGNNGKSDFDFYLRLAKPLVLNLPQTNDRILAAAWIKKLADDTSISQERKSDCLKLLLLVLQKRRLYGAFLKHPDHFDTLEDFELLEDDQKAEERREFLPYVFDCSADLKEYTAFQEISDFGVHCYYAMSNQAVTNWDRVDRTLFPLAPNQGVSIASKDMEKKMEASTEEDEATKKKKLDFAEKLRKKVEEERKQAAPVPPIGKEAPPPQDRIPPSWGSNLIGVKELPHK